MMVLLVALLLVALALTAYAAWRGAPWLPTPPSVVEAVLDAAKVGPGDYVVDLGAGDGRVLLAAARRGARAVGYELSPLFWMLTWLQTRRARRLVSVKLADGFRADLSPATVLFAFLRPATMPRLAEAMRRSASPGVRLFSYAFSLPDRSPTAVIRLPDAAPVYRYDAPGAH